IWQPELEARGETADQAMKLFVAAGSAAVITGGVLYFLGARQHSEVRSASVIPTRGGASVAWAFEF
ncbi:MAG: LPXTG cell wall anchor domain-containing protein, partial [Deltaproteobacteria bacterium]|nr:LPXTG cell wall anchor domain-containing protein [Deltaproteobacteria bacterium]